MTSYLLETIESLKRECELIDEAISAFEKLASALDAADEQPKRAGRPRGSKNKPKQEP